MHLGEDVVKVVVEDCGISQSPNMLSFLGVHIRKYRSTTDSKLGDRKTKGLAAKPTVDHGVTGVDKLAFVFYINRRWKEDHLFVIAKRGQIHEDKVDTGIYLNKTLDGRPHKINIKGFIATSILSKHSRARGNL